MTGVVSLALGFGMAALVLPPGEGDVPGATDSVSGPAEGASAPRGGGASEEGEPAPPRSGSYTPPAEEVVEVLRVLDGDTIEVIGQGWPKKESLRYLGVNAPELFSDYYGTEARDANRALVEGKSVRLAYDESRVDDLGRVLAYVYVGESCVNKALLKEGYVRIHPDYKHFSKLDEFEEVEGRAMAAGKGIWEEGKQEDWKTTFLPEDSYLCSKGTVHRPTCNSAKPDFTRIESIEEAMRKRHACKHCLPTRNHPTLGAPETVEEDDEEGDGE